MSRVRTASVFGTVAVLVCSSVICFAQGPGGPRPGGPARPGGMGGMMGPVPPMMRRPAPSVLQMPIEWVEKPLSLTAAQKTKLLAIQTRMRGQVSAMFRQQPPRDQASMRATMEKMGAMSDKATKEANAILTPAQRSKVPGVLKQVQVLSRVQIPPPVMGDLNLTPAQVSRLEAVAQAQQTKMMAAFRAPGGPGAPGARPGVVRPGAPAPGRPGAGPPAPNPQFFQRMQAMQQETHTKAMAVLTPAQRTVVTKFEKSHPRGMGPMGGPGGPRGMMGPGGPRGMMGPGRPMGQGGPGAPGSIRR